MPNGMICDHKNVFSRPFMMRRDRAIRENWRKFYRVILNASTWILAADTVEVSFIVLH